MKAQKILEEERFPAGLGGVTPRILLVSEDPDDMARIHLLLADLGATIVPCGSYQEASDILSRQSFDLAVVGQGSVAFEGDGVLERARDLHLRTPIVVVSRAADMGSYIRAMELGAVDYFEAGTMPRLMLGVLEAYLGLRQAA